MFKKLKRIKLRPLLTHMIITLAYPAVKAYVSDGRRLLIFTDAMTIIAMVLLIVGVLYSTVLHGDFDISGFVFKRGLRQFRNQEPPQSFETYMAEKKEKREEAFNYPLFLGVVYLAVSAIIAYGFL